MFGLFKTKPYQDSQLGLLVWAWLEGSWKCKIGVDPHGETEIRICGSRKEPNLKAVYFGREISSQYASLVPQIQSNLFEHYEAYHEAFEDGQFPEREEAFPELSDAKEVWPHVSLIHVSVEVLDDKLTVVFAYIAAWDEEHTLGAVFQDWKFIELCGSI